MSEEEYDEETDDSDEDDEEDEESSFPNLYSAEDALYDPRRRRDRSGRFVKRRKLDPRRRKRRGRKHDPRRRRYRRHDPEPRRRRGRGRAMRLFDIAGVTPFWSAILTPAATAAGSIAHNWAYKNKIATGTYQLPLVNANITTAGFLGGLASVLMGYFGYGKTLPSILSHVGAGAFAEGLNVPATEGFQARPITSQIGAGMGGGRAGGIGGLAVAEYANAGPMGLRY